MRWTDEQAENLRTLVAERLSARQISMRLGFGRGAIIGKCKRLGLTLHGNAGRQASASRRSKGERRMPAIAYQRRQYAAPNYQSGCEVHILAAENHHCRFPMWGDDAAFSEKFYCGTPGCDVSGGRPYCAMHSMITYRVPLMMQAAE